MSAVEELTKICAALPANKVDELVDFARFLQMREKNSQSRVEESPDDAAWEKIIADPTSGSKLESFVSRAQANGPATPLEGNL